MSSALYFIAATFSFVYALAQAISVLVILLIDPFTWYSLLYLLQPVLLAGAGIIFVYKYRNKPFDDSGFVKQDVVSVLGIGCFIIGLYIFTSNIAMFWSYLQLRNEITADALEKILSPLVLTSLGIYFGFFYKTKIC